MKITFEFEENQLPEPYQGKEGFINLVEFLRKSLYVDKLDDLVDCQIRNREHLEKPKYHNNENEKRLMAAVEQIYKDRVEVGKLLMGCVHIEPYQETQISVVFLED